VKELLKLANIWWRYRQEYGVSFFDPPSIYYARCKSWVIVLEGGRGVTSWWLSIILIVTALYTQQRRSIDLHTWY